MHEDETSRFAAVMQANRLDHRARLNFHMRCCALLLLFSLQAQIPSGSSAEETQNPDDASGTCLLISARAQIRLTEQQTFVAELPIQVLGQDSWTSRSKVFLMLVTIHGGSKASEYVAQIETRFSLGDLEDAIADHAEGAQSRYLRIELPRHLPAGRYVAAFELLDTSVPSVEDQIMSIRELPWILSDWAQQDYSSMTHNLPTVLKDDNRARGLLLSNAHNVSTRLHQQIQHPEDEAIALHFSAPVCIAGMETFFQCHIRGLVQGVEYKFEVQVRNGAMVLFEGEWELDGSQSNTIFNATIPALSTTDLDCPDECMPLQPLPSTVLSVFIFDRFPGLPDEEALLGKMVQRLKTHAGNELCMVTTLPASPGASLDRPLDIQNFASINPTARFFLLTDFLDTQGPVWEVVVKRFDREEDADELAEDQAEDTGELARIRTCPHVVPEFWSWFELEQSRDFRFYGFLRRPVEMARQNASTAQLLEAFQSQNRVPLRELAEALDYVPASRLITPPSSPYTFHLSSFPFQSRTLTTYTSGSSGAPRPRRHPRNANAPVEIGFHAHKCVADTPTFFRCRLTGLVRGVGYGLAVRVSKGDRTLHEDEWLLDNIPSPFIFNATIPALSTAALGCPEDCLPMQPNSVARISVSILDRFPRLYEEESVVGTMVQELEVHCRPVNDEEQRVLQEEQEQEWMGSHVMVGEPFVDGARSSNGQRDSMQVREELEEDPFRGQNVSCAILFFGLVKQFKQIVLPSISEHLLRSNPSCDVYAHTYNISHFTNPRNEEFDCVIQPGEIYLLTPNVVIDDDASYERTRPDHKQWRKYHPPTRGGWVYPNSIDNLIREWHSIERVWHLMEASGRTYRRVGLFRLDSVFTRPIALSAYSAPGVVCDPSMRGGGWCDRMFLGDFHVARRWASQRFSTAEEYVKTNKELHAETFMQHLLKDLQVEEGRICIRVVRACGPRGIQTSDCEPAHRHPVLALTLEWLGINRTPVDITEGNTPLLYRKGVGKGHPTGMELVILGSVPSLSYRILVQEVDPITGGVMRSKEMLFASGQDAPASELIVKLVIFDTRPDTYGDRVLPRFCRGVDDASILGPPRSSSMRHETNLSICLLPTSGCPAQKPDGSVCFACMHLHGQRACQMFSNTKAEDDMYLTPG